MDPDSTTQLQFEETPENKPDAVPSSGGVIIDLNEFDFAPSWAKQLAAKKKSGRDDDPLRADKINPPNDNFSDRSKNRQLEKKRRIPDDRRPNTKPTDHTSSQGRQHDDKKNKHTQPRFRIELLPEASGTESLARQIRVKCRAYPVYELAGIILQKQERYAVRLIVENHPQAAHAHTRANTSQPVEIHSNKKPATMQSHPRLFHCLVDNTLWLNQQSALQHIFKNHLQKYYEIHNHTLDPPKGNFTHIAVCGITGEIISPPNFHGYQAAMRETYRSKSIRMPFEAYRAKVKILKDEALLQQWLKQASQKTFYTPRHSPLQSASDAPSAPKETHCSSDRDTQSSPQAQPEQPQPASEARTAPDAQAPEQNPLPEPGSAHDSDASDRHETETIRHPQQQTILSFAEVEKHFLENFSQKTIRPVSVFTMRSETSRANSDPFIIRQIHHTLEAEQNFPLNIGRNLIQQLSQLGLHFFKTPQNILHVTPVRPTPFAADENSVKDNIKSILRHIQLNPRCNRRQLLDSLVPDFEQNTASSVENPPAELTSQPENADSTPRQKAAAQEALAILKDLHWLIRQGHIVEYASGELELPDPQKQILNSQSENNRRRTPPDTKKHRSRQKNKRPATSTNDTPQKTNAENPRPAHPSDTQDSAPQPAITTEDATPVEADNLPSAEQESAKTEQHEFHSPRLDSPAEESSSMHPADIPSDRSPQA